MRPPRNVELGRGRVEPEGEDRQEAEAVDRREDGAARAEAVGCEERRGADRGEEAVVENAVRGVRGEPAGLVRRRPGTSCTELADEECVQQVRYTPERVQRRRCPRVRQQVPRRREERGRLRELDLCLGTPPLVCQVSVDSDAMRTPGRCRRSVVATTACAARETLIEPSGRRLRMLLGFKKNTLGGSSRHGASSSSEALSSSSSSSSSQGDGRDRRPGSRNWPHSSPAPSSSAIASWRRGPPHTIASSSAARRWRLR
mmetsp:Transcript_10189/g.41272  ORF Transcript_10189/g.41272 Transcript_10189/m.41272 type:complete len:258 (+) Transcript_10189:1054-1827(+)